MAAFDEIADGFALWQEHQPQTGEDWAKVAERFIAAGETTENSSPLFAAVVLQTRRLQALQSALRDEVGRNRMFARNITTSAPARNHLNAAADRLEKLLRESETR